MKTKTQLQLVRELMTRNGKITPAYLSREDCTFDDRMIAVDSIRRHCATLRKMGEFGSVSKKGVVTYWAIRDEELFTIEDETGEEYMKAVEEVEKEQTNLFNFDLP